MKTINLQKQKQERNRILMRQVACYGHLSQLPCSQNYEKRKQLYKILSSVQLLSCVQLFVTLWNAARQASLSITNSWSLLKLMPIELMMLSNHLSLCRPLLLPPSVLPSIRVFSDESELRIRWPKYCSFSISPSNIQDWFPLGWTGWISCSPRDSQESSPVPQFKSITSLALSFLYSPTLISIYDYWKNHSFD